MDALLNHILLQEFALILLRLHLIIVKFLQTHHTVQFVQMDFIQMLMVHVKLAVQIVLNVPVLQYALYVCNQLLYLPLL